MLEFKQLTKTKMDETTTYPPPDKTESITRHTKSKRERVLGAGAIFSSFVAMSAIMPGNILASGPKLDSRRGSDPTSVEKSKKLLSQLPGYKLKASSEKYNALRSSTVKILSRRKGDSTWTEWCTAVKISFGGKEYLGSAAHCFGLQGGKGGIVEDNNSVAPRIEPAIVYDSESDQQIEYSVGLPEFNPGDREANASGKVTKIAVLKGVDFALLKVEDDTPVRIGAGGPSYNSIPAIMYDPKPKRMLPGQEVAQVGIPQSSENQLLVNTGRYLGTYSINPVIDWLITEDKSYIGVFAFNEKASESDSVWYGSSGSGIYMADGTLVIGLITRTSLGYGPQHEIVAPDSSIEQARLTWAIAESRLNVKTPQGYNTLAYYPVLKGNDMQRIADVLK